jgi:hypothetical protein
MNVSVFWSPCSLTIRNPGMILGTSLLWDAITNMFPLQGEHDDPISLSMRPPAFSRNRHLATSPRLLPPRQTPKPALRSTLQLVIRNRELLWQTIPGPPLSLTVQFWSSTSALSSSTKPGLAIAPLSLTLVQVPLESTPRTIAGLFKLPSLFSIELKISTRPPPSTQMISGARLPSLESRGRRNVIPSIHPFLACQRIDPLNSITTWEGSCSSPTKRSGNATVRPGSLTQ